MVNIEKWNAMPASIKMGNIGSEVCRVINCWEKKSPYLQASFERSLELIDATLNKGLSAGGIRELRLVREWLVELMCGAHDGANGRAIKAYFDTFALHRESRAYFKALHPVSISG